MKQIFLAGRIFLPGFFFACIFSSCSNTKVITITGRVPGTDNLMMVDDQGNAADTILVDPDQKIKWKIQHGTDVMRTDSMPVKNPGTSGILLEKRPHKRCFSKSRIARVKPSDQLAIGVEIEEYNIIWTDQQGNQHKYDPRIQLNSRTR